MQGSPQNQRFCGARFGWFAYYCWVVGAATLVLTLLQK